MLTLETSKVNLSGVIQRFVMYHAHGYVHALHRATYYRVYLLYDTCNSTKIQPNLVSLQATLVVFVLAPTSVEVVEVGTYVIMIYRTCLLL